MAVLPDTNLVAPIVISTTSPNSLGQYRAIMNMPSNNNNLAGFNAANEAIFIPFRIHRPTLVANMFWQNGGTVSGNFDIGIYNSGGNLIVSAGSTAQAGTSVIQAVNTTDVTLQRGLYYMAFVADNTTGLFRFNQIGTILVLGRAMGVYVMSTAFPLPSTATFAALTRTRIPIIGLTVRPVV